MTEHKYGPKGHIVEAFIEHLRDLTPDEWAKFRAARNTARNAARNTAWHAAQDAAWVTGRDATGVRAWQAAWVTAWNAAWVTEWDTAGDAAGYAAWEIQGSDTIRERGWPFFFLPLFGFADEAAVIAAQQPMENK